MLGKGCSRPEFVEPNLMSDELCKKCPPAIILTSEFDMYRRLATTAAKLFEKNGKLIEFGILKGCHHGSSMNFSQKRTDEWFRVHQKIAKQYL